MSSQLTQTQRDAILNQEGFGNLRGKYWFIGMEEGGGRTLSDLLARAEFKPIEGLRSAQERIHPLAERKNPDVMDSTTQTWTYMSQIALRLSGDPTWNSSQVYRAYRRTRLGELDGETFLAELLPLARPSRNGGFRFLPLLGMTEADYAREIPPLRRALLQRLLKTYQPSCVFCYGKSDWPSFKELFSRVTWRQFAGDAIEIGRSGTSSVVLLPFLGNGQWKANYPDILAQNLGLE